MQDEVTELKNPHKSDRSDAVFSKRSTESHPNQNATDFNENLVASGLHHN